MLLKSLLARGLAGIPGLERSLHRAAEKACLVFVGHVVSDRELPHIRHLYRYRREAEFEQDLDYLLARYRPLDIETFERCLRRGWSLPPDSFFLTFDDGLRDCTEVIAPALKRRGVPAMFFITSGAIDNARLLYRHKASLLVDHLDRATGSARRKAAEVFAGPKRLDWPLLRVALLSIHQDLEPALDRTASAVGLSFEDFLQSERPYMTRAEVAALAEDGFAIGAHSVTHPSYQLLSSEERVAETRESLDFVRPWSRLEAFAFPYNDQGLPLEAFDDLRAAGVEVSFGTGGLRRDTVNWNLHRIPIENGGARVAENIAIGLSKATMRQMAGRGTIARAEQRRAQGAEQAPGQNGGQGQPASTGASPYPPLRTDPLTSRARTPA